MTSKDNRGPYTSQWILKLCQTYGLSVGSDVQSVHRAIKDTLAEFPSARCDEVSFAELKRSLSAEKAGLVKSRAAYDEKFAEEEHCIQKFEYNKDTLDDLGTKVDEAEANLKTAEKRLRFIEDEVSKKVANSLKRTVFE